MHTFRNGERGQRQDSARVANILRGAWRSVPPPLDFTMDDLQLALPLLQDASLTALAWWRIRRTPLAQTHAGVILRQEYVTQSIRAAAASHRVYQYVSALQAQNIDPIVFKGWALVPHYAEAGMRPAGDVDLAVAPYAAERAAQILRDLGAKPTEMDVHPGLADAAHAAYIPHSSWEEIYARSLQKSIGAVQVRVLDPADELQLLCIHFLRHLGARPIWLCDIAAALETRPENFDWTRALAKPPFTSWIECAILLAHELLDANLENTPLAARQTLPTWLVSDVLQRWAQPRTPSIMVHDSVFQIWRNPARWKEAVAARVPNRLAATLDFQGSLDEPFLARYQARWLWRRLTAFAERTVRRAP